MGKGKIYAEVRVIRESISPFPHHGRFLPFEPRAPLGGLVIAARGRFEVVKPGKGRPDDAVAGIGYTKAQIDVVIGDTEIFGVKPADFFENIAAHHQAGGRHGRNILRQARAPEIPGFAGRQSLVNVRADATDTEHDAGMLDGVVAVVEQCADGADIGPDRMANHFVKPSGLYRLDVVVDEPNNLSLCCGNSKIVYRGEVKLPGKV